ncbi:MAG: hypothetical protein PHD81_02040 [Candidatus Nanoarchaeia archaeon]|nr:hypothetical protein [Candidatus Nanoarchaeia archaeon]MDD5587870.1 hypothetical protein [Candidatus Nanoarchaeia archaeon]
MDTKDKIIGKLKHCYNCKSTNLKPKNNLITLGNKFSEIKVLECQKCGETYSSMDEAEKVRKTMHPSIINRISSLFTQNKTKSLNIFRDKLL